MLHGAWRGLGLGALIGVLASCSSESSSSGEAPDGSAHEGGASGGDGGSVNAGGSVQGAGGRGSAAGGTGNGGTGGSVGAGGSASSGGSGDDGGPGGADSGTPGPSVDRSDPQLHEFSLEPNVLDPSTVDSLSVQFAQLDTRSAPLGKLVVFLPGANNVPRDWRDHGRKLAEFGFHVLIPHYNNRWSSNDTCAGMGSSCGDDTRWEALVGEDTSSAIEISRADSAEGRVVTMLNHLVTDHPGGDWGYYFAAPDELAYGKIIIAGISHGAASAGMYAARRAFVRNVMHASGPAGSASASKATPLSEWYAFVHTDDPAYDAITSSWERFELIGELTSIDGQAAPFGGSHRLTASTTSSYPHVSVVVHDSSPTDSSGNYVFEPAWRYLYGVPTP